MTEPTFNQNQTQFSVDEPILAQPAPIVPDPAATPVPPKPKSKRLWLIIGGGVVLFFLLLMLILRGSNTPTPTDETTTPAAEQRPLTPLELRLETAKALLRDANPITQDLPFPPIDMTLRIDDP